MRKVMNVVFTMILIVSVGLLLVDPVKAFMTKRAIQETSEQKIVAVEDLDEGEPEPEVDELTLEQRIANANKHADELKAETLEVEKMNAEQLEKEATTPIDTRWDEDSRGIVVGKVSIPAVNMNLPIMKGVGVEQEDFMEKGAVTNKLNQEMGKRNYVLSSHHMIDPTLLFTPIVKAEKGDKVYITDEKNVYVYETVDLKVVDPYSVEILDDVAGKKLITLYTCVDAGENRHVLTGELVETLEYNEESAQFFN